ncbi:MAG TPA: RecX family transcriptional regulator [Aggregatilineaceae bacterium]|nr:RecX family transcriptional regulator [Aggregatilineaceae bacterium]
MARTITALEIQKRDKDRISIYLDGEFAFGLPIVDAARLHKGQVLSEQEIARLRGIDDLSRALDQAVRLLARRPYSSAEILRHLGSKQVAEPVIEEVLAKLEQLGYVDDRAFAQYWIENRDQFGPRGPRALRYELHQKGVSDAIIQAALDKMDPHDSAYRAAQAQVRRLRGLSQQEFRNRLGSFLARRGFDYDIVREVTGQLITALQEEQPDYFADDQAYEE